MINHPFVIIIISRSPHGERGLKSEYIRKTIRKLLSLPAWGAWIEILDAEGLNAKYESLPAWGAWIEMRLGTLYQNNTACRSPHGERGLKSGPLPPSRSTSGRSPHGERGLKYVKKTDSYFVPSSLPAWGAWIEIDSTERKLRKVLVAPRMGSVD